MPRTKTQSDTKKCVCSLIDQITILWGNKVQGEIFFKHHSKCRFKTTGTYEWAGAGFKKLDGR